MNFPHFHIFSFVVAFLVIFIYGTTHLLPKTITRTNLTSIPPNTSSTRASRSPARLPSISSNHSHSAYKKNLPLTSTSMKHVAGLVVAMATDAQQDTRVNSYGAAVIKVQYAVILQDARPMCQITISGLIYRGPFSSTVTEAHLHAPSERGNTAPCFITLFENEQHGKVVPTPGYSFSKTALVAPKYCLYFAQGQVYFDLHTVENHSGEIRAQFDQETCYGEFIKTSGVEQSNGSGTVMVNFPNINIICLDAAFWGLSSPLTLLEIHEPRSRDKNEPVIIGLDLVFELSSTQYVVDNYCTIVDLDLKQMIMIGEAFVTAHTEQYPAGEIMATLVKYRGQTPALFRTS